MFQQNSCFQPLAGKAFASRLVILLMMPVFLVACSRQGEQAPAQKLSDSAAITLTEEKSASAPLFADVREVEGNKYDELLEAIFQRDFRPEHDGALVEIKGTDEAPRYLVTIVSITELADGRVAVVANAMPSSEDGKEQAGHSSPGLLNVYVLQHAAGAWQVLERRENIAAMGSNGHIGRIEWVKLAPEKQGFVVFSGGVWQGYSVSMAEVFDLAEGVRGLGGFRNHSSNAGACNEQTDECWEVTGNLRFVDSGSPIPYRDILVDFTGRKYTVANGKDDQGIETSKATIRETARYRFDGKQYELISGINPVPEV